MSSHVSSLATTCSALAQALAPNPVPTLTFVDYMAQLTEHATVLDARAARMRQTRQANQSQQCPSNQQGGHGKQSGRGRGGGQGQGRGGRRGNNNNGSNNANNSTPFDVTDPNVWLTHKQYRNLTPEQCRIRYECKQANRRSAHSTATTQASPPHSSVPPTVSVQAMQADTQSVAGSIVTNPPPAVNQPGTVLCSMMSASSAHVTPNNNHGNDSISINGVTYTRRANVTHVYCVNEVEASSSVSGALMDGGANGGPLGTDAHVLETSLIATADVIGVTEDVLTSLPIVQAAAKIETVGDGPIIGIFSSYAQRGDGGCTIHSKGQMESFGLIVDDKSCTAGGSQCIVTNEGYVVPLHVRGGLTYMDMEPASDTDMENYPHVFFCADSPYDPSILDNEFTESDFDMPAGALTCHENNDS